MFKSSLISRGLAALMCTGMLLAGSPARAQSEASLALSMLPVASVMGTAALASGTASAVVALPAALLVNGAVFTVTAIEVSARNTVIVLQGASNAAALSLELSADAASGLALSAGSVLASTVIASGVVLSAAGEALLFIPNAIGNALLYDEYVK